MREWPPAAAPRGSPVTGREANTMEFDCPECGAPHAFPEDQIPLDGITVACTACAAHISLDRHGVKGQRRPEPPAPSAPPPPAPSVPPRDRAAWPQPALESTTEALDIVQPSTPDASGEGWDATSEAQGPSGGGSPRPAPPPTPGSSRSGPLRPRSAPPSSMPPKPAASAPPSPERSAPPPMMKAPSLEKPSGLGKALGAAAASALDSVGGAFDEAIDDEMEGEVDAPGGLSFPGFAPGDGSWTWRDLPRAFVGVFDLRRVIFTTAGFWAALAVFGLLQWLGGWLGAKVTGLLATVFSVAAWGGLVAMSAFAAAVMGFVCHQTVVEQRASSISAGVAWTKEWIQSVVGTPLAFVAVAAVGWLAQVIVAYLGRIPFAGPIVWGVLSPVLLLLGLAAGAVIVALIYSLPLYIPVIYNEKTSPVDTLKRLFGLFRTHGFSLVGHVLLTMVTIAVSLAVTVLPMYTVGRMVSTDAAGYMGGNYLGLLSNIPGGFQVFAFSSLPIPTGSAFGVETGFGHTLGGILAGIGSALPLALVWALVALAYYTAGGIIYAIVTGRKK